MRKIVYILLFVALSFMSLEAKSYKYDDLDRVIEVAYESGEKIYYAYDEAGNMTYAGMDEPDGIGEQYYLNDIAITNPAIVSKIKETIDELETIQGELGDLTSFEDDALREQYDGLKSRLDDAMSKVDAIKQSIDDNIADNDEKVRYKAEADKIKQSIEDIKTLIDGYKLNADNSPEALEDINGAIDRVISMMRSGGDESTTTISIKQGRNTISGTIDVTTLPETIHSVWIVDGGNWYGYSPHPTVRDEIEEKYLLIEGRVASSKGMIVFAMEDTQIESIDVSHDIEHSYGLGYTLHGTNGASMSAADIVCDESRSLIMVAKVRGDEPSVFVPERQIGGIENFEYLDSDDGYFVLCDEE